MHSIQRLQLPLVRHREQRTANLLYPRYGSDADVEVHQRRQRQLGLGHGVGGRHHHHPQRWFRQRRGQLDVDVFGPSLLGRGEDLAHGLLHMDAMVYPGSLFEWQVLDATTASPVPGFERLTSTWADLGMIDADAHPLLRFKVHAEGSTRR